VSHGITLYILVHNKLVKIKAVAIPPPIKNPAEELVEYGV